MALFEYNETWN